MLCMKRRLLFAFTAFLFGAAACAAQAPPEIPRFFPVSTWYSGGKARAPMLSRIDANSEKEWRADLEQIKQLGFNTVRTWVEWTANEPHEGDYHFENLDLMLKLANEVGLKVIVQVYVDSAPEWVGKRFPDGEFESQGGLKVKPQSAPGYCFDHPGVRKAMLRYFQEVAKHASQSPAFYAWDLWSEPAVMNWAEPEYMANPSFCYCPYTQARFRDWLKEKYATLDALNRAWYRTFEKWDDVQPPRFGTILTYTDFMDWREFIADKIAADLKMRSEAVKQIDPAHYTTSHAPNPSPVFRTIADAMDASDDYLMKSSVDFFGTSFYPKLTSPEHDMGLERRALVMDMVKSVTGEKGFYVGELQSGYGVHGIISGNPITPNDLELYTWGMIARGAKAINYYAFYPMSTGYESLGYGLINLDGTLTERSKRAGEIAKTVNANADLLLNAKPEPAQVAVVFNPLAPLLGGENAYGDRHSMHRAVAGYHRMFFERNMAVDFPSARELDIQKLHHYKLVIVPYPLLLTAEMANTLRQYAADGGHLFIEARAGWVDEQGHAQPTLPGFGWHQMIGVRESQVLPRKTLTVHWGTATFVGMSFEEQFQQFDPAAKAVATFDDGAAAAYEKSYGKGSVIILGTFAGEPNAVAPVPNHPLADLLITWAGIQKPQIESSSFVEVRTMQTSTGALVFLFNHENHETHINLKREYAKPVACVTQDLRGPARCDKTPGRTVNLDTSLEGESVRIYELTY